MKTITIQVSEKLEQYQVAEGSFIFVAGDLGRRTGRVKSAVGAVCHNQRCGKVIQKGDIIYSKSTAGLHRAYYHLACSRKLNII